MSGPTVREELRDAAGELHRAGVDDPMRDARVLMAAVLGIGTDRLTLHEGDTLDAAQVRTFREFVARRRVRQPVAQIIGHRMFWGRGFLVTPDTLDPRPETETLVAEALRLPFTRMLDLGTGTGCILLSCLADMPGATGLGTDISPAALAVAGLNAKGLGLADRAAFVQSDWFADVPGQFDLIVSNPPYIAPAEMAALAPEVRDWEPEGALTPGGDGLAAYRAIAGGAAARLMPGGRILLEIGPTQAAAVSALLVRAGLAGVRVLQDLDGRDRVVAATKP